MGEIIERVARAIAPKAWTEGDSSLANQSRRTASLRHAKLAIAAMWEPTEEMLRAALVVTREPDYGHVHDAVGGAVYRAMIDEAQKGHLAAAGVVFPGGTGPDGSTEGRG